MCGRYTQTNPVEVLEKRFRLAATELTLLPRYNLAPGQEAPTVVLEESRLLKMMKWGLVPFWAKDVTIGNRMINARAETLSQKPSFRNLLGKRHCLVLADGFFEWHKVEGRRAKVPMHFVLKTREPFAFAGLWDRWEDPEKEALYSFTIVTTQANELVQPVHHRMPAILRQEHEEKWLNPRPEDRDSLPSLLEPYPPDEMEGYEVSTAVNSPNNDTPECIEPMKGAGPGAHDRR